MKMLFSSQKNHGLTLIEVIVVVAVLTLAMLLVIPPGRDEERVRRIHCISNLKQIAVAARIWEGDHGNQYPMAVSATNGGGREWIATADLADFFRVMTNDLATPRILFCPSDMGNRYATNFYSDFNNSRISYFVNADAIETHPQQLFMGDDNLATNGVPLKSGIVDLPGNSLVSWTEARHRFAGNISFADGRIEEETAIGLQTALGHSTNGMLFPANHYAIP